MSHARKQPRTGEATRDEAREIGRADQADGEIREAGEIARAGMRRPTSPFPTMKIAIENRIVPME